MIYNYGPTQEQNREIFSAMEGPQKLWPCRLCHESWEGHMVLTAWCPIGGRAIRRASGQVEVQSYDPMDNFEYIEFTRSQK